MKKGESSEIIVGERKKKMSKEEILRLTHFTMTLLKVRSLIILEELKILVIRM